MCRSIHLPSLVNVAPCPAIFSGQSPTRLTKAQKAGLAFQRQLAKELGRIAGANTILCSEKWFAFRDRNGPGCASPDLFLQPLADGSILLLEAKLKLSATALDEGLRQLQELYVPLLRIAYPATPIRSLLVGKFLSPAAKSAVPLVELRGRDLTPDSEPLVAFWAGGRIPTTLLNLN